MKLAKEAALVEANKKKAERNKVVSDASIEESSECSSAVLLSPLDRPAAPVVTTAVVSTRRPRDK